VEIGFGNWIATYAQAVRNADTATAALLTSAFWGIFTAGRLVAIPIATVLKPRAILWINLIGAVVCLGALVLFPDAAWALWGGSMGFGLFLASTFPTMLSLAERNLPLTGRLASMFYMGISTGGMILPWLTGQFFDASGPRSGMWVILGGLLLAVVLFIAFVGHTERQTGAAGA
jgi:FHS family Na+ dependent glucose MFS transporter 1